MTPEVVLFIAVAAVFFFFFFFLVVMTPLVALCLWPFPVHRATMIVTREN